MDNSTTWTELAPVLLGVFVRYYGDDAARELEDYLKAAPAALLDFLKRHPAAHNSQWDPTTNPPA